MLIVYIPESMDETVKDSVYGALCNSWHVGRSGM